MILFIHNYQKLSKNDWELHLKYIKEGNNPDEISKIIRNDEIEKLQDISTHTNFDFNQEIIPSLYERYLFINQENDPFIDYAAFFVSIKCFKNLLMNVSNLICTCGNEEIIHAFTNHAKLQFHRNNIFYYLFKNKIEKNISIEN